MDNFQIFIMLMAIAIILVGIAQKIKVPYPLALVLGGALLGFLPGLSSIYIEPDLLLALVLPPLLHYSAIWISFRDFKKNIKDIFSLALGLVFVSTLVVGMFFKWLFPEAPWALAFTFGAIISPPDAVSATTILKRFNIGSDLMTVLEGEALINDAFALLIYKMSVVALFTGAFSLADASIEFAKIAVGGILLGVVFGYFIQIFVRQFLPAIVAVMLSFTLPYIVYIVAMSLEVSGVLAVVAFGLITSWFLTKHYDSYRRMLSVPTWGIFIILLNCFVFILIGLQLKSITAEFSLAEISRFTGYALAITAIMILIRLLWVMIKPTFCFFKTCDQSHIRNLDERTILAWSGMRGIISLACALALPLTIAGRDVVIFITFEVILLTLIIPSLTLPLLLKWLKIHPRLDANTSNIRKHLIKIAETEIESLLHLTEEERIFLKNYIKTHHRALEISATAEKSHAILDLARRKLLQSQRDSLIKFWEQGQIDDTLVKTLELELDLEEQLSVRADLH